MHLFTSQVSGNAEALRASLGTHSVATESKTSVNENLIVWIGCILLFTICCCVVGWSLIFILRVASTLLDCVGGLW